MKAIIAKVITVTMLSIICNFSVTGFASVSRLSHPVRGIQISLLRGVILWTPVYFLEGKVNIFKGLALPDDPDPITNYHEVVFFGIITELVNLASKDGAVIIPDNLETLSYEDLGALIKKIEEFAINKGLLVEYIPLARAYAPVPKTIAPNSSDGRNNFNFSTEVITRIAKHLKSLLTKENAEMISGLCEYLEATHLLGQALGVPIEDLETLYVEIKKLAPARKAVTELRTSELGAGLAQLMGLAQIRGIEEGEGAVRAIEEQVGVDEQEESEEEEEYAAAY